MEGENDGLPPEELRCRRSDGRGWRCKRRSLDGKSYCETHLNRLTQKKSPKIGDVVGDGSATPKPAPRIRFRIRVKPEYEEDVAVDSTPAAENASQVGPLGYDTTFAMLALPAPSPPLGRGPRTKRPSVVGDVEVRENGGGGEVAEKQGPQVETPAVVVGDLEGRENGGCGDSGPERRGPRTKRPMINDVEGRENGVMEDMGERRGPRTKRPSVVGDVEGGRNEQEKANKTNGVVVSGDGGEVVVKKEVQSNKTNGVVV